jgi:glucose-1-phosphate thymidylyltransferase
MLPVANKPILEHVIRALAENNITDIIIVVGYKKERIMDYFRDGVDFGVKIEYVHQDAQLGTAHALKQAKNLIEERFLVLNGDNLIEAGTIGDLLTNASGDATILTVVREQTTGYGVVVQEDGRVLRIVEKPREVIGHLVNTGMYLFSPVIFEEINHTPVSETGEYAITDTIQRLIDAGSKITTFQTEFTWIDVVHSWDLLKVNTFLISRCEKYEVEGMVEEGAVIKGDVFIGKNTIVRSGSYILGPVIIGKNCDIGPGATILPSTSIGSNVSIGPYVYMQNSILMNDVHIGSHAYISHAVIGTNNTIGSHFLTEVGRDLKIEMRGMLYHAEELGTIIGDGNTVGHRVLVRAGRMIYSSCNIESGSIISKDIPSSAIVL